MSLCVFALIASEFMPVSLLTPMAAEFQVTEGMVGQGIAVSGVFAHIFPSDAGFNMVDVVEIGGDGCAISRTLLTEEEWNSILVRAAGVAV